MNVRAHLDLTHFLWWWWEVVKEWRSRTFRNAVIEIVVYAGQTCGINFFFFFAKCGSSVFHLVSPDRHTTIQKGTTTINIKNEEIKNVVQMRENPA